MKSILYTQYDEERIIKEEHKKGDKRNPFQIDRDRIIHSSAFRRLQGKTQVYGAGLMDFYRTRLTHSIEVSQIAKSIGLRLRVNIDLVEGISLAHDIGHPPFGHTGESKLNEILSKYEGFEANAHNIIILGFLETKIGNKGLNLTRATLDGLLKYKTTKAKNPQKFLYEYDFFKEYIDWIDPNWQEDKKLEEKRSIECQIVNWADNVAYSVHDLEDGLKGGLLTSHKLNDKLLEKISQNLKNFDSKEIERIFHSIKIKINNIEKTSSSIEKKRLLKKLTSDLINEFVKNTYLEEKKDNNKTNRYRFKLKIKPKTLLKNVVLREIEKELIYKSKNILRTRKKCEMIIERIFEVFSDKNSKELYPPEYQEYWELFNADREEEWRFRLASWYIAGMTDNFAIRTYKEFFDPNNLIDIFISV